MANKPLVERFRAWLREHGLPVTPQRLAIADVVLSSERHLSADEVVEELASRGTRAGTATVYRTLDVLVASGLAVERDFAEGFRRFEPARDRTRHEHFLCMSCGVVDEFHDERIERLTAAAAELRGFTRERYRLVIYGVCRECRQSAPQPAGASAAQST